MAHTPGTTARTAGTAALGVDGPQPVWMTLNQARERAFTGEIVFETDPEVHAYLDNGIVYYAERAADASLGRRLVEAGVVDADQLERGTVRVGDIDHLGRLFDRAPSVDRDAVIVMAESATEQLITDLANRSTATVRATAYRHHPSGVHRWFAPIEPTPTMRPASTIAPQDTTVIDGFASLPFTESDAAELIIEWETELGHPVERRADLFELSLDFTEYTGDPRDDRAALDTIEAVIASTADDLHVESAESRSEFEFCVVWPDGSEGDGDVEFTMAPLVIDDETNRADAEVPHDVANAVRRAIAAIESASVSPPGPVVHLPVSPAVGSGGFAPPTMDMRAEVLCDRRSTDDTAADDTAAGGSGGGDERRSALRRLIGGLGRKDH